MLPIRLRATQRHSRQNRVLDLFLLSFIGYVLVLGLRRPFLWVLLYVYIDILAPQRIGYTLITTLPLSLIAFAAAFGGWLALDRKDGARFTLRQGLMLALLAYCWWTTGHADFPEDALTKWDWVWKALLFAIFLPLTLTTRARIEAVLRASFSASNFRREAVGAWLNFYVLAQTVPEAKRLLARNCWASSASCWAASWPVPWVCVRATR